MSTSDTMAPQFDSESLNHVPENTVEAAAETTVDNFQTDIPMEDRVNLLTEFINHPDPELRILPPVKVEVNQMQLQAYRVITGHEFDPANPTAHDDVVNFKENKVFQFPEASIAEVTPVSVVIQRVLDKVSNEKLAAKVFSNAMKKKKKVPMKEVDATGLMNKFNTNKPTNKQQEQKSVLLVPANRQASSFLQKAFNGTATTVADGVDGVDHINISSIATTDLGKFLDINAKSPFEHRELANFTSVGGLWYYVKGKEPDERFRYTWGDRCRLMGKNIESRNVVGFKTIIADATWMKIIASERAVKELSESTLPFKNYYHYGSLNLRKTTPEAVWYTAAVSEIRRTLKLRISTGNMSLMPDFFFLEEQSRFK